MARVGVVLLTMGEPEVLDQVRPYLRQLLADRDQIGRASCRERVCQYV